jgi:hypothetical protein
VRELAGGDAERDDERQVEQQLERRCHPMRLVRVTPAHGARVVVQLLVQASAILHLRDGTR